MMQQCEVVLLTQVQWAKKTKNDEWLEWLLKQCWHWLLHCIRYHLDKVRKAFIAVIAADKGLFEREEYKRAKREWDKALVVQVLEDIIKNKK